MLCGRVFTIFEIDCRFGLPLGCPFLLQVAGNNASVVLLRELAPLEFVDPSNYLEIDLGKDATRPFRCARPVALPETKDVALQAMTVVPRDTKLDSPEATRAAMANATLLAIFEPLGMAASLRSRLSTEVAIVVERTHPEWSALGKGQFDESHAEIWDEFIRTYHMVTGDVRPPLWNDSHRLMVVKQGWIPYETTSESDWKKRIAVPAEQIPIDRHRVVSSYAQEGTFSFDRAEADAIMRRYFADARPVPLGRETLSGALRAVDLNRSGKTAVVECTIALEIAVSEVVTAAKLKGGVSKKKLDEYKKEVGIGYQLNVDLPIILAPFSDADRQILGAADAVRKRRNQIIHEGTQATREEGQQAVAAVRALLNLLHTKGYLV